MSMRIADEWRTARKPHRCQACWGTIGKGDRYRHQRVKDTDGIGTWQVHALCDALYWRAHRDNELFDDEVVSDDEIRSMLVAAFTAIAGGGGHPT
jgi:hypothetical protein